MVKKLRLSKLLVSFIVVLLMVSFLVGCSKSNKAAQNEIGVQGNDEEVKIKIGVTPGEDAVKTKERFRPFIEHFEARTGYETELFIATDFASVIEAMRAKEVDVAFYGPLSYVLAADIADAEAFAAGYEEGLGQFLEAYIVVHPDSGINDIQGLKGKDFAFVDPASTGGYLIPTLELMEHGINPEVDFASTVFAGGHDACVLAVKNKNVDGATVVKRIYIKMQKEGLISEDNIKIIHTTNPFPGDAWAFRKDLPEDVKANIKDALLNLTEEDKVKLKDFMEITVKWVEAKDSDWDSLREAARLLNIDLESQ